MSDWDDYGGAKPPSKLTLALLGVAFVLFVGYALALVGSEFVGAFW